MHSSQVESNGNPDASHFCGSLAWDGPEIATLRSEATTRGWRLCQGGVQVIQITDRLDSQAGR